VGLYQRWVAERSDLIEAGLNEAAWLWLWGKRGGRRRHSGVSAARRRREAMDDRGAAGLIAGYVPRWGRVMNRDGVVVAFVSPD
jgi:hypothetical protein